MSEAFDAIMADLQVEFQATLNEHHAALRVAQRAWNDGDPEALSEIQRRVHRIAGVAGLFQAEAIGATAEAVERALLTHQAHDSIAALLETLLDRLPPLTA